MSINSQLQDDIIERTIVLNRFSSGTGKRVVKLLQDAQTDIIARLPEVQGIVSRRRLLKQLDDIAEILDTAYADIDTLTADELQQLAEIEARWQFKSINTLAGVEIMRAMPTADMLREIVTNGLVVGNPTAEWWNQQSRKAQDEFKRVVRLGLSQSETNQQITKRVKDAIGIQQRGAFALVKTATQSVAIGARKSVLMSNPDVVKGIVSIATLDGRTTLLCANYDKAAYDLDLKPIPPNKLPFIDVPRHINCLTGDTLVSSISNVSGISKRWFNGNVFVVTTASGAKFTCTPNHPVLTERGWVSASDIAIGDSVFNCVVSERKAIIDSDDKNVESTIHDVFESFLRSGKMFPMPVPLTSEDFHGDASNEEIAIVLSNSFLRNKIYPLSAEIIGKLSFICRYIPKPLRFIGGGLLSPFFKSCLSAFSCIIGIFYKILLLLIGVGIHSCLLLFRSVSRLYSVINKYLGNNGARNFVSFSNSRNSYAGIKKLYNVINGWYKGVVIWFINTRFNKNFTHCIEPMWNSGRNIIQTHSRIIKTDYVVSVEVANFSGHVYNLITDEGWYCANGIVTHNCRSQYAPLLKSWKEMGLPFDEFKPSTRASLDGQIPASTTFDDFLSRKPKEWQDEYLGKGRAELYRAGKITLSDMINGAGRELTLEQLRKM